jgi:hypothetical protein
MTVQPFRKTEKEDSTGVVFGIIYQDNSSIVICCYDIITLIEIDVIN